MKNVFGFGVFLSVLSLVAPQAQAQSKLEINGQDHLCSFAPDEVFDEDIYSFSSSEQADEMVAQILSTVGLVPRFRIYAANVPNAAAVIDGDERLIVYSEDWIQNSIAHNRWAAVALLGHEIAHHLNGHTLEAGGSRPPTELEADKFAGFAVGKLGGNLQEAQWLFQQLPASGSDTHPPRGARLEAVAVGWRDATGGQVMTLPATTTSNNTSVPSGSAVSGDWFVIAGSYPHASAGQANDLMRSLEAQGVPVSLVNTNDFSKLRNGLYSVVVATNSRSRAFQELEVVKRYVPDAYVKKGN